MEGIERISNILKRKKVDRIGLFEHFWGDTHKEYVEKGYLNQDESFEDHFNFDIQENWTLNLMLDLDFKDKIIDETEDTITILDGNGAYLRKHKKHDSTPEHVNFTIKTGDDWKNFKQHFDKVDERRINFETYRKARDEAKKANRFFVMSGVNVFESMHPICGHENLLVGMALEPGWVLEMAKTYADQIIALQEILFSKEGKPDGIWYYEDMGYKEHPFMSPAMYKEMIQPFHKQTIDFAKSQGLPVIMHSCGYVKPLLPYMIEAGIDCYQTIEIKAGMDLLEIHKSFGDVLSFMGGIDVRTLYSNDKKIIDKELESKIPFVKEGFGYVLHSDHSIPKTVDYDTYKYFIEKGLELGQY